MWNSCVMEWRDQGVLLAMRGHGESAAIIEVLTRAHGRHAGVVRGGASRRLAPLLQPGNQIAVAWRARLSEHIGTFTVEPLRARAAGVLADRLALAGLSSICALLAFALPEREACPALHDRSAALLDLLPDTADWPARYLRWELALLEETGFGLDLSACAVTGARDDLAYVSPRSGRAVSRGGAGEWAARLLPLPECLLGQGPATGAEVAAGLRTTGYFLSNRLAPSLGDRPLPAARARLFDLLARQG
jgi:DNA repair protein RecO (recombination protein O)